MPQLTLKTIPTFLYRACSRCGGDLYLEEDELPGPLDSGPERYFFACLQCGRRMVARRRAGEEKELVGAGRAA